MTIWVLLAGDLAALVAIVLVVLVVRVRGPLLRAPGRPWDGFPAAVALMPLVLGFLFVLDVAWWRAGGPPWTALGTGLCGLFAGHVAARVVIYWARLRRREREIAALREQLRRLLEDRRP